MSVTEKFNKKKKFMEDVQNVISSIFELEGKTLLEKLLFLKNTSRIFKKEVDVILNYIYDEDEFNDFELANKSLNKIINYKKML